MRIKRMLVVLLCLALLPLTARADEAPYYTLTEIYSGEQAHSPAGYLPDGTYSEFDGKDLKRPADVFVDENDNLFISDEGNKRVIMCTLEGEWIRTFGNKDFKQPGGIYVRNGKLYVTDVKLRQVLVYDVETGKQVLVLEHPGTPLYGVNAKFEPLEIAVDDAGGMYVISKGNTNGIAQFAADGTFLGYFGANDTNLSHTEKLKRLTYTEEQLAKLKRVIPATPTALDMDARGLLYTVTTGVQGVKRLNMAGVNIMEDTRWGFDNTIDVAVGAQENIFVVNELGYIMEYTRDGRCLFHFGGQDQDRTRTGLFVNTVAIDVDSHGNLYVLDRDKALVQRFAVTDYANLVHKSLALYQEGRYAESREPWEQVLQLNSMFDYAHMGLGRAYYKLEMYEEALQASRRGGDKEGYSDSYWEVRNIFLQDGVMWLIGGAFALWLAGRLWKVLKARVKPVQSFCGRVHDIFDVRLLRELRFAPYFLRNPADAFYGVKHEGKVSVLSATILYVAAILIFIINKYSCGFLFKTVQDGQFEVGMDLAMLIGGIALFLIACNLICSIRDGEGTFKQMYCSFAYALGPYVMLKPVSFALSFVLTYNEAFIITLLDLAALCLCLMLVVMMVKSLQNYTFTETFTALLLTLFTMLMIIIAMVIAAALVAQLWEFITAVWKEARFYNEV
ncbi:MAG: YIP1 family protein [Clostridia bacterium]|nr:YIP1 family protein [Clostridia bacterium]